MGLLNKLKNVLFEEEEIEETKDEVVKAKPNIVKPKTNNEPTIPEFKNKNYNVEDETDRELFKAEKTFDFPAFDEDEFEDFVPKKVEEPVVKRYEPEKRVINNTPRKKDYTSTRIVRTEPEKPKTVFRPSPVISPVYGILDKNYKKEDVVTRDEMAEKKNIKLDVDSVRKKAFGTLEEDLEKTINESLDNFYEETPVTIEAQSIKDNEEEDLSNLLKETIDAEIDVTKEMEIPSRTQHESFEEEIEDKVADENEVEELDIEEEIIEEPKKKTVKKEKKSSDEDEVSDDTLESDLFELIDSMYENREDEE